MVWNWRWCGPDFEFKADLSVQLAGPDTFSEFP
jgi:hypothetical protein